MKKSVLFVINTLGTAGAEKALLELLRRFDKALYEVDLYVLLNQGELIGEVPSEVNVLNKYFDNSPIHGEVGAKHLKKFVLRSFFKRGALFRTFFYLLKNAITMVASGSFMKDKLLWRTMAFAADKNEKEYALAVSYIEGGSAYYVDKFVTARKKVSFFHVDYSEAGYNRNLDKECYCRFDRIFPISDEVSASFLEVYPELSDKTVVFHNILDMDEILSKSKQPGGFDDGFNGIRLLSIGRLNRQKAFEVSIDAMKILREKDLNCRWYVLGEGDQRDFLQEHIDELGLSDDFILLGNKENPYNYLNQCDIYVHASKFEGKSIAIQEAQVLSKPIIVSDCHGNREQVTNGIDGLICDFNSNAIAMSIIDMMEEKDRAKKMGMKAYDRIAKALENDDIGLLYELCGEKR